MTPRSLNEMANRLTAYEVTFTYKGETIRLGFTERHTKAALIEMARQNGKLILSKLDAADADSNWTYSKARGVGFGSARVDFSGKTERECASELQRAA